MGLSGAANEPIPEKMRTVSKQLRAGCILPVKKRTIQIIRKNAMIISYDRFKIKL